MGVNEHKQSAPAKVRAAILSISTTRRLADDKSGLWIAKQLHKEGHELVLHRVVADEVAAIKDSVWECVRSHRAEAIVLTGGTGISPADVTIEAVKPLFSKELTAFGPLFAMLSFEQIDSAAILSRATAGIIEGTVCFCIPGSLKACKLACNNLILPELTHLMRHVYE